MSAAGSERVKLARIRLEAIERARTSLVDFAQLMRPVAGQEADPRLSTYEAARHHVYLAEKLERVAAGDIKRLIVNMPPRSGKTELSSKIFPAWMAGRFPDKSLILATYNEKFSFDFGRAVRNFMKQPGYKQVFPHAVTRKGAVAANRIEMQNGGLLVFTGVGGSLTGRGGHTIICDDLIKDRTQADSQTEREKMWSWFQQVLKTRLMDDRSSIMIITTRWHPDDVVGRLTDPTNSYYDAEEASRWEVIDLPAFAVEDDPLGRKPGEVLWPTRFGEDFLENMRRGDPRGFSALYQCRPSPEKGAFFQSEWLSEYKPNDLPSNLRYYLSVDFAVSSATNRDRTCIMPIGIDDRQNIWVLPDVWWQHGSSEQVVEAFVNLVAKYKPLMVWGEKGQISKSLGPFIRKRMTERNAFAAIDETHPAADKQARAQSIAGRMAMGKVMFPVHAPWWPSAKDQVLKFPQTAHDDFVDALSLIGMGLMKLHVPKGQRDVSNEMRPGTYGWMKEQTKRRNRMIDMAAGAEGW